MHRTERIDAGARGSTEFDCIFDFTAVERLDLVTEFVAKRDELPQALQGSREDLCGPSG